MAALAEPQVTAPISSRFYCPELDALRFFAFLGVFVFHALPHDPSAYASFHLPSVLVRTICAIAGAGAFGVDLFFALSAYLITRLFLRERQSTGQIDIKAFYLRRILRIWPLYFTFLFVAAMVQHIERPYVAGYLLLAGNWVYTWRGLPESVIVIPLWSVSVEEQFYLLWPLIVRRTANLKHVVIALLAIGSVARIVLAALHVTGAAVEYNTFARIDAIAWGIALALMPKLYLNWTKRFGLAATCLTAWILTSSVAGLNAPRDIAPFWGTILGRPIVAFAAFGLLVAVLNLPSKVPPVLAYLGKISYGLYVFHVAGLAVAKVVFSGGGLSAHIGRTSLGFALTVIASAASYRWLESPFLRLKDRFARILTRPV